MQPDVEDSEVVERKARKREIEHKGFVCAEQIDAFLPLTITAMVCASALPATPLSLTFRCCTDDTNYSRHVRAARHNKNGAHRCVAACSSCLCLLTIPSQVHIRTSVDLASTTASNHAQTRRAWLARPRRVKQQG